MNSQRIFRAIAITTSAAAVTAAGTLAASAAPLTRGPVSLSATTGSVTLDGASVRTSGTWVAPESYDCVDLLLSYSGFADTAQLTYYEINLLDSAGGIIGQSTVTPSKGAPSSGTTSMTFCGPYDAPLPPNMVMSLQLTEVSFADDSEDRSATGSPFTWSPGPANPPAPRPLPGTAEIRGLTVETTGTWLGPRTIPPLADQSYVGYSYLLAYAGLAPAGYFTVGLIDPRTRTQLGVSSADNPEYATSASDGTVEVSYFLSGAAPASFLIQLTSDAGDVVEVGPYSWSTSVPPTPVAGQGPQPVSLGQMVVTPTGNWSVPALCGSLAVNYTRRPNDWRSVFVRLIDAVTREELGQGSTFEYAESGTLSIPVCARVTAETRLILQVSSVPGIAETEPFRWEGVVILPEKVRNLKASATKAKGRVTLRWQPPSNANAAGVTSYEYRVNNSAWRSVSKTSVTVAKLPSRKTVTFTVRAIAGDTPGPEARVSAKPR